MASCTITLVALSLLHQCTSYLIVGQHGIRERDPDLGPTYYIPLFPTDHQEVILPEENQAMAAAYLIDLDFKKELVSGHDCLKRSFGDSLYN